MLFTTVQFRGFRPSHDRDREVDFVQSGIGRPSPRPSPQPRTEPCVDVGASYFIDDYEPVRRRLGEHLLPQCYGTPPPNLRIQERHKPLSGGWQCSMCSYIHDAAQAMFLSCSVCNSTRECFQADPFLTPLSECGNPARLSPLQCPSSVEAASTGGSTWSQISSRAGSVCGARTCSSLGTQSGSQAGSSTGSRSGSYAG